MYAVIFLEVPNDHLSMILDDCDNLGLIVNGAVQNKNLIDWLHFYIA